MKRKQNKDLFLFIILIPLFLWSAFYISSRMENQLPSYSVLNKSRLGCSIFFEAMKELNFKVARTLKPIHTQDVDSIQIVPYGGSFSVNREEIKDWVKQGGTLVYLTHRDGVDIRYSVFPVTKGNVTLYPYHEGRILVTRVDSILNQTLMEDTHYAYELVQQLGDTSNKKIFFNEFYLFAVEDNQTLWDYVPIKGKYILYQMFLLVAGYFYYRGKRFGGPLPLYDEVERTENEYLYSAASLYKHAGCWDLMLENYYKSFLKQMNCSHDDWLEYWEREKLPLLNKARKVYDFMHSTKGERKEKEYIQIVTLLEKLKNIIDKRRDFYWKVLQKTL